MKSLTWSLFDTEQCENSLKAVHCISHIFFCKQKINYHMKSNLSLLLPISFSILFPIFFCMLLFPSKSSLKSCRVQLTGLFQRIISFNFLKKQKIDPLSLIIKYQPAWSIYKIRAAACAISCSSPLSTTGGDALSPRHKSISLLELCSPLGCRHWYFNNQLNEHALLRKLSKANQRVKTCVTHWAIDTTITASRKWCGAGAWLTMLTHLSTAASGGELTAEGLTQSC